MKFLKLFSVLAFALNIFHSAFLFADDEGGAIQGDNGQGDNGDSGQGNEGEGEKNTESNRYKTDMFKYKSEAQKLREENEKLKEQQRKAEESKLLEKQNYKDAFTKVRDEFDQYKNQTEQEKQSWIESRKYDAIEKEAIKQGIDPQFLDFIKIYDTKDVELEGNKVVGVKELIELIKADKPKMFDTKKDPNINNGGNNNFPSGSTITMQELTKLEKTNYDKYVKVCNDIKTKKVTLK